MKISCNTFEASVVTLSRNRYVLASSTAATPTSSRSWAKYTTHATAARCFVANSALSSGRSLRSPSFSTVALSGVDTLRQVSIPNSRNHECTCLRSGRTPRRFATLQYYNEIDGFFSTLFPNPYPFRNCFFSQYQIFTWSCAQQIVHMHTKRKCLVFYAETPLDG